jgi:hypothetical protein
VRVAHPKLRAGDHCPLAGCGGCGGKLYDTKAPYKKVELEGVGAGTSDGVAASATLRGCQETFAAPLPETAMGTKYHPSVSAVLAVARYGLGLPHYRLAQWQEWAAERLMLPRRKIVARGLRDRVHGRGG